MQEKEHKKSHPKVAIYVSESDFLIWNIILKIPFNAFGASNIITFIVIPHSFSHNDAENHNNYRQNRNSKCFRTHKRNKHPDTECSKIQSDSVRAASVFSHKNTTIVFTIILWWCSENVTIANLLNS